jgi:hypothetical protein
MSVCIGLKIAWHNRNFQRGPRCPLTTRQRSGKGDQRTSGRCPLVAAAGDEFSPSDHAADPARGWFTVHENPDGYGKEYCPGPRLAEAAEAARRAFGDELPAVKALVDLLRKCDKGKCEVIATLYAAWNDLLLDGQSPDDEAIIREARENWHPAKQRIEHGSWVAGLAMMRREKLVPKGTGRRVAPKPAGRGPSVR